jgi:hypothetical protein
VSRRVRRRRRKRKIRLKKEAGSEVNKDQNGTKNVEDNLG